jgi:hypothetical protein
MSDPSGQQLHIPLPAEISAGSAAKGSAPSHPSARRKARAAQGAAFLCGALVVAGSFELARSPAYLGGAGLFAALVTGIFASLLARADIPVPVVLRPLSLAAAGGAVTLASYGIAINAYSPDPHPALAYIQPVDGSNHDVRTDGTATFSVTVPSDYDQLTISFAVRNYPPPPYFDACINGSEEGITPEYGAYVGPAQDVATGAAATIQFPRGAASFTLAVEFLPTGNFRYCDEIITVSAAQFGN